MRKTASCWLLDRIHESVRMLPVRLALCDLEALGWRPWFPHCASSVASWLTDCCMALCGLLFRFCLHCHTNPWGDTMYSCIFQLPMNWSADYRPCWFLFLFWLCCLLFRVLVCFVCFCVFGVCFLLHGDSSNGLCFVSHCHYDQCCYCINSVNLHNAIIFPAWWTTWREHLALDGKKSVQRGHEFAQCNYLSGLMNDLARASGVGRKKSVQRGVAQSGDGLVNVAWVVLHCNRRIGARERRHLIPHVRFQVPFLGPESQLKSGFACAGLLCTQRSPYGGC